MINPSKANDNAVDENERVSKPLMKHMYLFVYGFSFKRKTCSLTIDANLYSIAGLCSEIVSERECAIVVSIEGRPSNWQGELGE